MVGCDWRSIAPLSLILKLDLFGFHAGSFHPDVICCSPGLDCYVDGCSDGWSPVSRGPNLSVSGPCWWGWHHQYRHQRHTSSKNNNDNINDNNNDNSNDNNKDNDNHNHNNNSNNDDDDDEDDDNNNNKNNNNTNLDHRCHR